MAIEDILFLVVDDSKSMRRIISSVLCQCGVGDIVEAGDGIEALKKLALFPKIGMVLCDWNMPNMNGLTFLKEMRNLPKFKTTPFLMITTENQKENVIQAVTNGANNYLAKPFTKEALKDKLEKTLASVSK